MARTSLLFSGEHLRLARDAINARQVYPGAHFIVLRGALVGAAQAVWILAAKGAPERQERGLTLIVEMYRQLRKYYGEVENISLTLDEQRDLERQIRCSKERSLQVADIRRTSGNLNQTDVIGWALDHRFPDDGRRATGELLWRQMSADAQVLGWSVFQRATVSSSDFRTGLGVLQSAGDLEYVAEPFVAIHQLLSH